MQATFRLFPWDVDGDRTAPARLRDLGVTRVALAAMYHGGRMITPHHPRHRIVDLPASASYTAQVSPLPRGRFSYERARDALLTAGIEVDAWAVVAHLDGDSDGVPRVVNAYGDRLEHAPCLAQEQARRTLRGIAHAAGRAASGATLHLEAGGWASLDHGGLHDKLHGADLDDRTRRLLALCTCLACATAAGVDRPELVSAVRWAIDTGTGGGASVEAAERARSMIAADVATELVDAALDGGAGRVTLSAEDAAAYALGAPSGTASDSAACVPVERLVDCWGDAGRGVAALRSAGGGTAYVDILTSEPAAFAAHWRRLAEHGAKRLHIYHAGLASTERLRAAVDAAAALRAETARAEV
jgi:hypothetical protein